jgi:hypothetical protein
MIVAFVPTVEFLRKEVYDMNGSHGIPCRYTDR